MPANAEQLNLDLTAIAAALKANLNVQNPVVEELLSHLLFNAGKRLRPLLAVLCARYGGDESHSLTLACVMEYLHAASLLHDDILDGAPFRRGKTAAHHIWGNTLTILGGDLLMARTTSLVADLGHTEITRKVARLAENIIGGEVREITAKYNFELSESDYYAIIEGKTAALFKAACECGSVLGGCIPQEIVVLGQYGLHLGMAFQIADDIADYCGDSAERGKLPGNDLREGKATLPLILALNKANAEQKQALDAVFAADDIDEEAFALVKNFIETAGGFAEARAIATNHLALALKALDEIRPHAVLTTLKTLAENIID